MEFAGERSRLVARACSPPPPIWSSLTAGRFEQAEAEPGEAAQEDEEDDDDDGDEEEAEEEEEEKEVREFMLAPDCLHRRAFWCAQ